MKPLLPLLLASLLAQPALAGEPSGLAGLQCRTIDQIHSPDSAQVHAVALWIEGYLYGYREEVLTADSLLQEFDEGQRRMWISAYCAQSPQSTVQEVAQAMVRFIDSGLVGRPKNISG